MKFTHEQILLNFARELGIQFSTSDYVANTLVCYDASTGITNIFFYDAMNDKVIQLM